MQGSTTASDTLMNMLGCVLDNKSEELEKLLMENIQEVNNPIGMPFELANSRFYNHTALSQMSVSQHPRQTLLDIASAMPSGPVVWVLLSYGAKGSKHPLGADLALHNAIRNGRHYTVQSLLISGRSDVDGLSSKPWKPLLQAVFWNRPEIVNILLKRGAKVDDPGPSPDSPGLRTALQWCLKRRICEYSDENVRSKCNEIIQLLLHVGASIHVSPSEDTFASPFEMFIEPWQNQNYWGMKLSLAETDCLGKLVEKGADLTAKFFGSPCCANSSNTFIHQIIWHSPPSLSRRVVDSISVEASASGADVLHEVLCTCAEAKRHLAESLQDVEVLLNRGVNPNVPDNLGMTPLRKCIEKSLSTDVAALSEKLLDGGADPEHEDVDGVQPYAVAALTLTEPVRSEVLQCMIAKMKGHHIKTKEGNVYRWKDGLFPIAENPTYEQVVSSAKQDDDFMLSMYEMVSTDVQSAFYRAYLAVTSGRYFAKITGEIITRKLSEEDKRMITSVIALRKKAGVSDFQFHQGFLLALLESPEIGISEASLSSTTTSQAHENVITGTAISCSSLVTNTTMVDAAPAHSPFQLNTSTPSALYRSSLSFRSPNDLSTNNDAFVGDTTQVRWLNPETKQAPQNGTKVSDYVLRYKCAICNDDQPLTKMELQKHEIEHAHTAVCNGVGCARRFCKGTQKRKEKQNGHQHHVFANTF